MKNLRKTLQVFILSGFLVNCGGGSNPPASPPPTPAEITFSGIASIGIFDPSVSYDPVAQRLWMSYSYVEPSIYFAVDEHLGVGIRLAYSDDEGESWTDAGVIISPFTDQTVGPMPSANPAANIPASSNGTWKSETSSLVYDANAPAGERWKIIWHQYLKANGTSYFADYGWVAMKTASTPEGLASAPTVKLFGGYLTQSEGELTGAPAFSPVGGAAQIALNVDISNALTGVDTAELSNCVWAEPGLISDTNGLHLAIGCHYLDGPDNNGYVVMFSCDSPCDMTQANNWTYKGRVLTPAHASAVGYRNFSAPELSVKNGIYYLMVTPVRDVNTGNYDGCIVYQFSDFANAILLNVAGSPSEVFSYNGIDDVHNGACSAHENMTAGILHSQFRSDTPPVLFHMLQIHQDY